MSETGVNVFDYVNSKEVFVQDLYMWKCLIKVCQYQINISKYQIKRSLNQIKNMSNSI